MADQPVTQRQLLETNTELTKLIYETMGEISQRVNDGLSEIKERLARLEGSEQAVRDGNSDSAAREGAKTSRWVRGGLVTTTAISIFNLVHGIK